MLSNVECAPCVLLQDFLNFIPDSAQIEYTQECKVSEVNLQSSYAGGETLMLVTLVASVV